MRITVMTPLAGRPKREFGLHLPDWAYPVEVHYGSYLGDDTGRVATPERAVVDLAKVRGVVQKDWSYLRNIADELYWDELQVDELLRWVKALPRPSERRAVEQFLTERIGGGIFRG